MKKLWLIWFILGVLGLASLACNFPMIAANAAHLYPTHSPDGIPGPSSPVYVTVGPPAFPTPTPFLPLDRTAVWEPTPFPTATPEPTSEPEPEPTVQIIPPTLSIQPAAGIHNILVLGSDQRPNQSGFRTDTIVLVTLDTNKDTVSLTSFPRDLYVMIPGWQEQRINAAFSAGGFRTMAATFQTNFGVTPEHYVIANFSGFTSIIDALGGINVNVGKDLTDHRDKYGEYTVRAGQVWMDGETALWYVRARKTTSDYDRTRRQQEVLIAMFYRLISLDALARAPELYDQFRSTVVTDMSLADMLPYLGLAGKVAADPSRIERYAIGSNQVIPYVVPETGAQVLIPDYDAIQQVLRKALHSP